MKLEEIIKSDNETIKKDSPPYNPNNKIGRGINTNPISHFNLNLEPKKIKMDELYANHYIKLIGYIKPVEFMNNLYDKILDKKEDFNDEPCL